VSGAAGAPSFLQRRLRRATAGNGWESCGMTSFNSEDDREAVLVANKPAILHKMLRLDSLDLFMRCELKINVLQNMDAVFRVAMRGSQLGLFSSQCAMPAVRVRIQVLRIEIPGSPKGIQVLQTAIPGEWCAELDGTRTIC
jgi:hypothetical protein